MVLNQVFEDSFHGCFLIGLQIHLFQLLSLITLGISIASDRPTQNNLWAWLTGVYCALQSIFKTSWSCSSLHKLSLKVYTAHLFRKHKVFMTNGSK